MVAVKQNSPKVYQIMVLMLMILLLCELSIYFLSAHMANHTGFKYQFCARYSARTSFIILLILLFWVRIYRLSRIYSNENIRSVFVFTVLCFLVNHLIHFAYVVLHYKHQQLYLFKLGNVFGAIAYVIVVIVPIYIWQKKILTKRVHIAINIFINSTTLVFFVTYLGRLSKKLPFATPQIFYYLCLLFILIALGINLFLFIKGDQAEKINERKL